MARTSVGASDLCFLAAVEVLVLRLRDEQAVFAVAVLAHFRLCVPCFFDNSRSFEGDLCGSAHLRQHPVPFKCDPIKCALQDPYDHHTATTIPISDHKR